MKIAVDFEFCFPYEAQTASMVIDLTDPAHAQLVKWVGSSPSIDDLEDELPSYLQHDVVQEGTRITAVREFSDRLEADFELTLDGKHFKDFEVFGFDDCDEPGEGEDRVEFLWDLLGETHHNFQVYVDSITILP